MPAPRAGRFTRPLRRAGREEQEVEVKVNREIREYTEGVFFGMSLRQCVFALLACVAAVGLYFGLSPFLRLDELSWACIAGAAPFAALGFVTWHGMAVERAAWAWAKYALLTPKELPARPQNLDTVLYNFTAIQSMKDVKKKVLAYTQDTHATVLPGKKKLNSDITLENVTFKRKSFALENINLTIKKGMKYAVVGHSGAGKSTLFKLIMGYEKNSSGVIRLDGEDIKNYDISELISYTDQNEHIYRAGIVDNITVFHSYPMDGIDSVGKSIWPEFFEEIFSRKEKECQRFSGGEKQAVAFLRMAAKNAEVILLDEPFSAMDAKMKSAVEHYLFTGKEFEGKTVLVITHDTREESLSQYDGIINVGENGIYVE